MSIDQSITHHPQKNIYEEKKNKNTKRQSRSKSKSLERYPRQISPKRNAPKTSLKLRDLVLAKRELEMKGTRANIKPREQPSHKSI